MHSPLPLEAIPEALGLTAKEGPSPKIAAFEFATDHGRLRSPAVASDFEAARFESSDDKELAALRKAKPSQELNLSSEEVAILRARLADVKKKDPQLPELASAAYREILLARAQAYQRQGFAGIAPYARGREQVSAGEELAETWSADHDLIEAHFPESARAVERFPNDQPEGVHHQFYWSKNDLTLQKVFALTHHQWQLGDGYLVLSERDFFAGGIYDEMHNLWVVLPTEKGSAVFGIVSARTEFVEGIGGALIVPIANKIVRTKLADHLEQVMDAP